MAVGRLVAGLDPPAMALASTRASTIDVDEMERMPLASDDDELLETLGAALGASKRSCFTFTALVVLLTLRFSVTALWMLVGWLDVIRPSCTILVAA